MSASDLLDQVYSPASVAELEADAGRYAQALATEIASATTAAELAARDAALGAALEHIDAMLVRVMRMRLDHALATDTSIGPPTRNVFASTIVAYARDLALLEQRARDVALRGRAARPEQIAALVVEAARSTLALRDAVRTGVLALIRDLATSAIPDADRRARDRTLDDAERKRWSALRRDLEATTQDPARITSAPIATRLAALPDQLDEPAPEAEVTFADMIELD